MTHSGHYTTARLAAFASQIFISCLISAWQDPLCPALQSFFCCWQALSRTLYFVPLKWEGRMESHRLVFAGLLSACLIVPAGPGFAHGAIAIGLPKVVAKDGVAQGYSVRAKTPEEARSVAMGFCGDVTKSSKAAAALCKVVKDFQDQCVALVLDPKPGTPGYGWGIGANKHDAERAALAMCYANAGADRRQYCKSIVSDCDGSANK
jgi:hypothetical protein